MSATLTPAELAVIRGRADAATPGPWYLDHAPWAGLGFGVLARIDGAPHVIFAARETPVPDADIANTQFASNACDDIPRLLAHIDAIGDVLRAAEAVVRPDSAGPDGESLNEMHERIDTATKRRGEAYSALRAAVARVKGDE